MPRTWLDGQKPVPGDQLIAHFFSKVDRNGPVPQHDPSLGPCWIWTDYRKENGYGQFYINRKPVYAHRFVCELRYGPLPPGMFATHKCDNGAGGCVRPWHIEPGTPKKNTQDAVARGRFLQRTCRKGHVYAEVGVYIWGRKRQCKACRPPKPTQICEGTTYAYRKGNSCLRIIPLGARFCYSHRPAE